jgi:hypothetical protein
MAGRRRITLDEKIANAQAKVDDLKAKLSVAEKELKELQKIKEEQEIVELKDIIKNSGMSMDEVKNLLSNK